MDKWNKLREHIMGRKLSYVESSNDYYECGERVMGAVWKDKSDDMERLLRVMDAMDFEENKHGK